MAYSCAGPLALALPLAGRAIAGGVGAGAADATETITPERDQRPAASRTEP
jgi:hypothetical protein